MYRHPRWFRWLAAQCAWLAARLRGRDRPASRRGPGPSTAGQEEVRPTREERAWADIIRAKAGGDDGGRGRRRVLPEEQREQQERQGRDGGRGR